MRDTPAGRKKYLEYLAWLAEDEPARKAQKFAGMSKGWLIGTHEFTKAMVREHGHAARRGGQLAGETRAAQEAVWQETLQELLRKRKKTAADVAAEGKSVEWKLALAAALKERTTATNRWLGAALCMGNFHEVSRKVAAWPRKPDLGFARKLATT
ncbi:MAG: hypothetical protein HY302_05495 [Opitutae bacterium]|nr:hypothetical protein [Opitutae bacterium]